MMSRKGWYDVLIQDNHIPTIKSIVISWYSCKIVHHLSIFEPTVVIDGAYQASRQHTTFQKWTPYGWVIWLPLSRLLQRDYNIKIKTKRKIPLRSVEAYSFPPVLVHLCGIVGSYANRLGTIGTNNDGETK